jgi:membrane protein implicated in regulation of membrane protease activity
MSDIGKVLMLIGAVLAGLGVLLWLGPKVLWLGRLPGDIVVERPNFKFYFPMTTCIILSVVLTLLAWLLRRH